MRQPLDTPLVQLSLNVVHPFTLSLTLSLLHFLPSAHARCGSPEHEDAERLAYIAIVLYPVGIPLLYLLLLISARGAIKEDRPTALSSALSFLHRDFEARMYGWEIAEQFKKLFLVGIMVRHRVPPCPFPPYPFPSRRAAPRRAAPPPRSAVFAAAIPTPSLC